MEQRYANKDPLADMMRSRREEIEKYRWIESERLGYDIGGPRAEREWRRKHARQWRAALRAQGRLHPIVELIWSQQAEIEKFKWIESERRGQDIGWEQAVREWCRLHYEAWHYNITREAAPPASPKPKPPASRSLEDYHREKLSAAIKQWWDTRKKAASTG
jgi:hypothetical protein